MVNLQLEIVARLAELRRERALVGNANPSKEEDVIQEIKSLKQVKKQNEKELKELEIQRLNIDKARKAILIS